MASLFDELERLVRSKQKVNPTTTGLLAGNKKDLKTNVIEKVVFMEAQAESIKTLSARIRLQDVWRNNSLWVHTLHVHCNCGQSFKTPKVYY